ncbi:MAG: RsmE family RNA methyltransferase, partial [Selenomonas bovis]|nr:RsmE family RNA methyltransferase [Selenomonas bovis]
MRRLFLKGLLAPVVTLAGDDAHHLLYAMRAKAGDEVVLVDDAGQVARMELTGFTADTVTMRLIERLAADTESPLSLVLAQCLPKGDKLEFIV